MTAPVSRNAPEVSGRPAFDNRLSRDEREVARVSFPHRRPASPLAAVMDPAQAALAAELLGADQLVPIHYDGYALRGLYEPVPDALKRLQLTSNRVTVLELGESVEI